MATIAKGYTFDSAHFLPGYNGKCARVHGHTYRVEVSFEGRIGGSHDMVADFHYLDEVMHGILEVFDHDTVNDTFTALEINQRPTAEIMACAIFGLVKTILEQDGVGYSNLDITLWETADSWVSVDECDWEDVGKPCEGVNTKRGDWYPNF